MCARVHSNMAEEELAVKNSILSKVDSNVKRLRHEKSMQIVSVHQEIVAAESVLSEI